jgi:hypothetical protein
VQFTGTPMVAIWPSRWLRSLATFAALMLGPLIWAENANARLDGQLSFGGAGSGFYIAPIVSTVLDDWSSFGDDRLAYAAQPTSPAGTLVGLFSRPGLIGGFAAGFLGAGLLGVLFGHGMAGGLTGAASALGLVFQLALVAMLGRLIWIWWRNDKAAAFESLSPRQLADAYGSPRNEKLPDFDLSANAEMLGEPEPDKRPRPLNN